MALYDQDNPDGPDHDFWRGLADDLGARRIVDLGCGTGSLTVTLAGVDRDVLGVDPSATMLDAARRRPGGERVSWVLGDSRDGPAEPRDLALMTGNVAQHIADGAWWRTLRDLRSVLVPDGTLAFESRNPDARAWEAWTSDGRTTRTTADGLLEEWSEAAETAPGVVRLVASNRFVETDETLVYTEDLRFRGHDELLHDLGAAGFGAVEVFGDWQRGPLREDSPVMVVVASAAAD